MLQDEHIGEILVQADELQHRIKEMAAEVSRDYKGRDLVRACLRRDRRTGCCPLWEARSFATGGRRWPNT